MKSIAAVEIRIAPDHPVFAGHFPARPIVPGALLIDRVAAALTTATGHGVTGVAAAKFLRPVGPGESLGVGFAVEADDRIRFEISSGDAVVARGTLWIAPAAPSGA
jgi:3-hydroxymyristoyl/3-hydroxydecanoyl-(acyl carrier protein) dehydratase